MARFRRQHRIFDIIERTRELARQRIEKLRERIARNTAKQRDTTIRETAKATEKARQFNLLARLRQKPMLEPRDIFFKLETLKTYMVDVLVARGVVSASRLVEAVNHGLSRIREPNMNILYELTRCVARYQTGPCASRKYYVKLTYTTLSILRQTGQRFALYIRRFIANARLRERLLNAIAFVIHALLRSRTKSRRENYNSEMLANPDSTLSDSDNVSTMRNDITQMDRSYPLAFMMRHPSFISRGMAMQLGMAEILGDGGHCSIYAMPAHRSKRKEYIDLPFQQYYDYIIYEDRQSMRGIT